MRHSPFLPTRREAILLLVFPLTLILGSLYTTFNYGSQSIFPYYSPPSLMEPARYSPEHQSFQPSSAAPSYFATKRNVLNVYFVKIGWFWVTIALLGFTLLASRGRKTVDVGVVGWSWPSKRLQDMHAPEREAEQDSRLRRVYQIVLRYLGITLWWIILTQWFFGPSLIDRLFRVTGGTCEVMETEASEIDGEARRKIAMALTNAACKKVKGRWSGGFDVSGHVFLLVLGSGMICFEMFPIIFPGIRGINSKRVIRDYFGKIAHVSDEGPIPLDEIPYSSGDGQKLEKLTNARPELPHLQHHGPYTTLKKYAISMAMIVAGLSWWMLLMTSAFFHTWVEKTAALLLASLGLWIVYLLPRGISSIRTAVGLPGV